MPWALGLDLATVTGVALQRLDICGVHFAIAPSDTRSTRHWQLRGNPGRRFLQLEKSLLTLSDATKGGISWVFVEEAGWLRGKSTRATILALGGYLAIVQKVAAEKGWELRFFNPKHVKEFATGYGNASKEQMVRAANQQLGTQLNATTKGHADEADAAWVLELGLHTLAREKRLAG